MGKKHLKKGIVNFVIPVILIASIILITTLNIFILSKPNYQVDNTNRGIFSSFTEEQKQEFIEVGKKVLIVLAIFLVCKYVIDRYRRRNEIFNFQKSSNIVKFVHIMLVVIPVVASVIIVLTMLYGGIVKSNVKMENQINSMPRPGEFPTATTTHKNRK